MVVLSWWCELSGNSVTNETLACYVDLCDGSFVFSFSGFSLWLFSDRHRGQKRGQGRMTWDFVEGHLIVKELKEGRGNNRSVMPLDALGRTRATMLYSECEWFCCL